MFSFFHHLLVMHLKIVLWSGCRPFGHQTTALAGAKNVLERSAHKLGGKQCKSAWKPNGALNPLT